MRLYAFLLLVTALYAHAATIPVPESEKKIIDVFPDDLDKTENVSSEQELIDQANIIKDVENKLRVKPEDIPVKVVVEDPQPILKTTDENEASEEINRTVPDLNNPGLPQRQEHETQNPGYYANEQEAISKFKQSINEAQNVLKQGFQGVTDGIQSMLERNEPIQTIQHSIQFLREGFIGQINKLNGTIQNYLQTESFVDQPAVKQTKAKFHEIEKGLKVLKNDFNTKVNTLADGVQVVAYLKAESESNPSSGSSPASVNPSPPFVQFLQDMQHNVMTSFQNLFGTNANEVSSTTDASAGALSDSQGGPSTGSTPSNNGWPWPSWPNSGSGNWISFFFPSQTQNPSQGGANPSQGGANPSQGAANPIQGLGSQFQGAAGPIQGLGNQFQGAAGPIQGLGNQFQGAAGPIQGLGNQFQGVAGPIQGLGNQFQGSGIAQNNTEQSNSTSNSLVQGFQNNPIVQSIVNFIAPKPTESTSNSETKPEVTTESHQANKPEKPESHQENKPEKPEPHQENKPEKPESEHANKEKPAADTQVTPLGPIRQILQNNPITKGIASAVQRIQNINNPEKPRDAEKTEEQNEAVKKQDEDKTGSDTKGHYGYGGSNNNSGDNNDNSGIKQNEMVKEEIEKLPEVQKPKEDEVKEHKSEEVVNKTE